MRLVTFGNDPQSPAAGAFVDGDTRIVDLQAAHVAVFGGASPHLNSVLDLLEGGDAALALGNEVVERAPAETMLDRKDARLYAPIQPPPQMRDCSCFELHLQQVFQTARKYRARALKDNPVAAQAALDDTAEQDRVLATFNRQPIYYKANRFAAHGCDEDVIWPHYSRMMDFELEWGCYIGKPAKDATREEAAAHIAGYTIFNDFTARDAQGLEGPGMLGPAKSKDFDTSNPMGPCLVTADEISDPYDLTMIARVNGEEWGRGNTGDMRWRFEDVIAHISRSETLHTGEFLGSGTVGGGCGFEHMKRLSENDVVELEIEQLGILRNRLVKR